MEAEVACGDAAVSDACARADAATAGAAAPHVPVPAHAAAAARVGARRYVRPQRRGLVGRSRGVEPRRRRCECGRERRADRLAAVATRCARAAGATALGQPEGRCPAGRQPVRTRGAGESGLCARRGAACCTARHRTALRRAQAHKSAHSAAPQGTPPRSTAWRAPARRGRREEGEWGSPCQGAPRRPRPSLTA